MAQTGYTPLQIYSSSTAAQAPSAGNLTNSTLGSELAINITDGKLFYKDNAGVVQVIAWKTTPTTAGGTGLTSYTAGDLLYYATGTTLAKLGIGASTTVLTSSGTAPQWTAQSSLSVGTASNLKSNATTGVMQIVGPAAASTRVMTIPDANFTAARTDAAQSFTGDQTLSTGNLIQGTAAKGVNFTANSPASGMTSQLLNWYEEGTWTPVLRGSGTAGTYETSTNVGRYTRVGRQVTIDCLMILAGSITGGGTGYAQITGLPFAMLANSGATGAVTFEGVDWTAGANLVIRPITLNSTSTLYFVETNDNAASSSVQIAGFSATDRIAFTLTYFV